MTPRLAAVLWDMDGTLIDSEPIWIAQQFVLAEKHGATWSREQGLALVGADMHDTAVAMQRRAWTWRRPCSSRRSSAR